MNLNRQGSDQFGNLYFSTEEIEKYIKSILIDKKTPGRIYKFFLEFFYLILH